MKQVVSDVSDLCMLPIDFALFLTYNQRNFNSEAIIMATVREIAALAGVSPSTVSRVINGTAPVKDSLRNKVFSAIQRLDNLERSNAEEGIHGTVGIIMPTASAMKLAEHPSLYTIVLSFISVLSNHGVGNTMIPLESSMTGLASHGIDGYLILGTSEDQENRLLTILNDSGKPYIFVNRFMGNKHASYINFDEEQAIEIAVNHLLELGHREIAFIGGNPDYRNTKLRHMSYVNTLRKAGIEPDPELALYGEYSERSGEELGCELLMLGKRPSAACVASDPIAIGLMRYLSQHGMKLPQDLSVIGFGDIDACEYVTPSLTTISQNSREIGSVAADALLQMMKNPIICRQQILLHTKLVVRNSCAPLDL